ncbi:MAG: anaerobic ribonucleoside-triphosphate reductase activating protein [Clostridiales bacterium]|nr:anaerobic ribonucleoside-triphosphate reductase activating protein [Clostridiales bacterium]
MKIHGLQKMTLLDFPGRVACTVFIGGCDFRCPFCHNFELVDGTAKPIMDDEELLSFLSGRKGLLDGVAFTGGEPMINPGLPELIRKIRDLGYAIKLDTNGYHPETLEMLLKEGLIDYVAMDIKNSPAKYAMTSGLDQLDLEPVKKSISLLLEGDVDYEFRTTVLKEFHEADDFEEMGKMIKGAKKYFLQAFTDRDSVPFGNLHAPNKAEMTAFMAKAAPYVLEISLRGID